MGKDFQVPIHYLSPIISRVKRARQEADPRKKDLSPSVLDFGPLRFKIARHFGFCFGVENAIEIAYRALEDHPDRRVFLLSEMIHNPRVNSDLRGRGVRFLRTTEGKQLIPFDQLTSEDVVIVPAFGTTVEIESTLAARGVDALAYDTTCPFVTKVWRRSEQIGQKGYTVIIHGKRYHEETRATLSHARRAAPVLVVRNIDEANDLGDVIRGHRGADYFFERFADRHSDGFHPERDLERIGVVNQTTMLASETRAIADVLRRTMIERYGEREIGLHFADTSDTLCYATNENQNATIELIDSGADFALVVGGYNSSNTSHLVELCDRKMPSYFISGAEEIESASLIHHFDYPNKKRVSTESWLPGIEDRPIEILLTAGASCPDALLDEVVRKILSWYPDARPLEDALAPFVVSSAS